MSRLMPLHVWRRAERYGRWAVREGAQGMLEARRQPSEKGWEKKHRKGEYRGIRPRGWWWWWSKEDATDLHLRDAPYA